MVEGRVNEISYLAADEEEDYVVAPGERAPLNDGALLRRPRSPGAHRRPPRCRT
ncbi:MAG: hypothetical protein R2749_24370 [Acidimicrobiales bacterium]